MKKCILVLALLTPLWGQSFGGDPSFTFDPKVQSDKPFPCDIAKEILKQAMVNGPKDVSCGSWVLAFTPEFELFGDAYAGSWTVVASTAHPWFMHNYPKRTYHLRISDSGDMGDGWNESHVTFDLTGYDEFVENFKKEYPECRKFTCSYFRKNGSGIWNSVTWGEMGIIADEVRQ